MKAIDNIISVSLRNGLLVVLGAIMLIAGGTYTAANMDIDVFPDLTAPTVVIMTDAEGMTAEEVERLVTYPVESAVNGAAGVRRVRSSSGYGNSFVWIEFDWGTDIYKARQTVSEKLTALAGMLPEGITPQMAPQSSVMGEVLFIGMQADTTSMMTLRTLADWVVKPAILATGGVSQVTVIGGDYKQYVIEADPARMSSHGVSLAEIVETASTFSDNSTGGVVREWGNEYGLRGMARSADVTELGRSLVKMSAAGQPVTLADVAEIRIMPAVKMGHGSQNAEPSVILSVSKQPGANTLDVTERVERQLESITASLPADVRVDTEIFRQADFISTSVSNVGQALFEGALFVVVVLFLFLNNWRTTVISIIAIPLSLLGTVLVLNGLGLNINTMTLGGMCIAIGSLVDDAIIDVENVYRRLRQNHRLPESERQSAFTVVFEASREIRASILNATLIIIVAFIPLFFLSGLEGRMLKPLGVAYIVSLFMSLIVAMTVTPLLSKWLLSPARHLERRQNEGRVERTLASAYRRSLEWTLRHPAVVRGGTALLIGVVLVVCFNLGSSFLPEFNEGAATISAAAKPGVSLEVSNELGNAMERELLQIPEVVATTRRTGRGELDEHSQATNSAEIDVRFNFGDRSRDEVFDDIRRRLAQVPGVVITIGQPLGHRIDHMISGTRANIAVKISGDDLSQLRRLGEQVAEVMRGVEGVVDVNVEQQSMTPQLQIRADREALARRGITVADFNRFVEVAFGATPVGTVYEGQRSYDVVVRMEGFSGHSAEEVRNAMIDTGDGGRVALGEVADIVAATGPNTISRENVQRKLVVSANVSGRDLGSAVSEMQKAIASGVELPEGYRVEYGGQFENARSASRTLLVATLLAVALIFLLLLGEFRSPALALIVLVTLPFALIGGVLAVWVTTSVVSIPAIIGFITLFGVATRNGILLVSRYRHLRSLGHDIDATVVQGSADRLNPILMTALTSALALIPLVIASDKPGNEIQSPMAVVVLGGLLTSTLLNLYLMPLIYRRYELRRVLRESRQQSQNVTDIIHNT